MHWIILILAIATFDQLTKTCVMLTMSEGETKPLIEGVFHFTHIKNTGASWGMFAGARVLFILLTLIVLCGLFVWYQKKKPKDRFLMTALSLIAGGAVGNLIDRIISGRVTDFFDFRLIHFPVFNIADIAITVGAILLFIHLIFRTSDESEGK